MADREQHIPDDRDRASARSANGANGTGPSAEGTASDAHRRRSRIELIQKYVIYGLGAVLGLAVFAVIVLLLVLQTEWGRDQGKHFIIERMNTLVDGAEFQAEELEGNFIGRIALLNLDLIKVDGESLVHADTFSARFSLIPLLRNTLKLKNVDLVNPRIWMDQQPDGSWDLFNVIARDDSAAVDTTETWATQLVIELDHLYIGDGRVDARFYAPDRDSVLLVRDLYMDMGNAEFGNSPLFELDSLVARFSPPAQDYWANLRAAGALNDSLLVVEGFDLTSPRSSVRSAGSLALPGADADLVTDIDFDLVAAPLSFDDLNPFVPGLRAGESVNLDLAIGGRQDLLNVDADALFSDGGSIDLAGTVSPDEPEVTYDLRGEIRGFDLSILTGNPSHESSINTDLSVDLAGVMLDALDGSANATIFATRFGNLVFDRTTLSSTWDNGRARIDARGGLREMAFSLAGDVRPFDESPSYNVSGRVNNFNLANFTDGDQRTDITATLRVDGRGFDQNAALTADVQVAPSTINNYRIDYGVLDLAMDNGRLNFGTRFRFPDGQMYAQGQANFNEDVVTYSVGRGRVDNLDVAALLGAESSSAIHGTFSMTGAGTDPNTLTLRGDVNVFDSHYGDVPIAAADLNVSLQNGSLRLNSAADLAEAGDLSLVAEGNPFADQPTLRVTSGEFRSLNLGPLTQNPELSTDLTGTAVFSIRGFDSQRMAIEGRIDLDPSRFNEQQINAAYAIADLNRGDLAFNASVELPEGQARVVGSAQPFRTVPTYSIDDGRFSNIDLAAFTGNESLESALTGTFSGSGRGFDPESMVFQGRVQVAPSVINQQQINQIIAQIDVQRGQLDVDATVDMPEGDVQLVAAMNLLEEVPSYRVDQGTFQNLNIGAITGNENLDTNLSGSLQATGVGLDPETMRLEGTLFLADSRVNEQVIDTATVHGTLTGGELAFDARMVAPEGISDLAGVVDFTGETLAYTITEGELQGLDVGALTGNPDLRTSITASVAFQGVGTDPETMRVSGTIDFSRSTINQATITEGVLEAALDDGLVTLDGSVFFTDGSAIVQAQARPFDDVPVYEAEGTLQNVDLGAILGGDTLQSVLTASFDLAGRGFDPETMMLRGSINSDTTRYQNARIAELRAEFALDAGLLQVDTLVLQSNFADVEAAGTVALFEAQAQYASDFTFVADIYQADPIRGFIPAETFALDEGHVEGRVYGRPGNLQFDVMSDITSLVYNDIRISGLDGRFAGEITPEGTLSIGELEADVNYFALPFLTIRSSNLNVTYRGEDVLFSGEFDFDDGQSAQVSGRLDLREDVQAATIESLDLALADQEWELLLPATISYGDAYRVSNFLLASDDGQIAVDGIVDPNGSQSLVLTIESFRFGSVADLVGYEGLSGTLDGELALLGPAYAPVMEGGLTFDVISEGDRVGDLDMDVRYDSLRLRIDAVLTHVEGGLLEIDGYVPTDLSLATADTAMVGEGVRVETQQAEPGSGVNFTVTADSFGINWIDPFLDPLIVQDVRGTLTGDVLVTGTFNAPILDGAISLDNGRLRLPEYNVTYQDIELDATLTENRLEFADARMTSGGSLRADGIVYLTELTLGEFDISARLDDFQAVRNNQYQITTSGNLELAGTTRQPEVTGSLQLVRTDIYLNQATGAEIAEVELTERDIRVLEERFGYQVTAADTAVSVFYENLTLDLTVEMGRDTWVRQRGQPEMAIQFEGSLDVEKEPGADPQIFGTIEVIEQRSYIDQFSRRFTITDGTITFNGAPENFVMDVSAEYQVKSRANPGQAQVIITLGLRGRLDDLEFTLGSNPSMPETDILSYIATGQPAGQSLQLADASSLFVSGGAGLALNEVATVLEGIAGEGLGLDVIEIQHDGLRGAVLIAGKYVSPRVYVGVSQPVSFSSSSPLSETAGTGRRSQTEVTLEYEIFNWLLLRLSGGTTTLRGNLLWEHAY